MKTSITAGTLMVAIDTLIASLPIVSSDRRFTYVAETRREVAETLTAVLQGIDVSITTSGTAIELIPEDNQLTYSERKLMDLTQNAMSLVRRLADCNSTDEASDLSLEARKLLEL